MYDEQKTRLKAYRIKRRDRERVTVNKMTKESTIVVLDEKRKSERERQRKCGQNKRQGKVKPVASTIQHLVP